VLGGPGIVVAPDLTPAETAALDRGLVRGLATARGGPTSHAAILARSLGIPAAVGLGHALLEVPEGAELLLDGGRGVLYVEPRPAVTAEYAASAEEREAAARLALAAASEPAVTRDGRRIAVFANLGSPDEAAVAVEAGAEGVGLLRTEFLFLDRIEPPGEDEQVRTYSAIAEALRGRPLVVRTLDAGADKPLPFLPRRPEENPFLGERGIRLSLAEPALLRVQLRAVLRAAARHDMRVMFPMVATIDEFRRARSLLEEARVELGAEPVEVGVMVEVPAAALAADALAREAAFLSIGTNDLAQYTMAAERGNERVAALTDALHPPVLRLIRDVAAAAAAHGRPVAVCGEVASEALAVPLLIGLGVDELSVSPPLAPAIKEAVRRVSRPAAVALAERALVAESASAVRALLAEATAREAAVG
jgi:phosphoenolpyruvate-protein phosphotransferase